MRQAQEKAELHHHEVAHRAIARIEDAQGWRRELSAQKWGVFTVEGGESFRRTCVALAAEHGFKIANPELQEAIAHERDAIARA